MTGQQEFQLNHYLNALWKGKWLILFTTLVAIMGVVAFVEFRPPAPPLYSALVTVRVDPVSSPVSVGEGMAVPSDDRELNTQIQIMVSHNVMHRATTRVNLERENDSPALRAMEVAELQEAINVRPIASTNLLEIRAQAHSPGRAQLLADAVVVAYTEYVKEERIRAIEDALHQVESRLEEIQGASHLNNRLALLLPGMGTELASIADSVNRIRQSVGEVHGRQRPHGVGSPLSWESPQIQELEVTLSGVSQDLQEVRERLSGDRQSTITDGRDPSNSHALQLDRVSDDLDMVTERLKEIQSGMQTLDPRRAAETVIARAEDAKTALDQVSPELSQVNTQGDTDIAEELHSVQTIVELVSVDLQTLNTQLQENWDTPDGMS